MPPTYTVNASNSSLNTVTTTSAQSESSLIYKVKDERDSEALKALINNHTGIYVDIVSRYAQSYPNVVRRDDLVDDRFYNLYRFILDYNPDKGTKLSTYIGDRTNYMCKTLLKQDKANPLTSGTYCPGGPMSLGTAGDTYTTAAGTSVTLPDEAPDVKVTEVANRDIQIEDIMNAAAFVCPDERFINILRFRHFNKPETCLSWRQIGKRLGISHEWARSIYTENLAIVKKHLSEQTV